MANISLDNGTVSNKSDNGTKPLDISSFEVRCQKNDLMRKNIL